MQNFGPTRLDKVSHVNLSAPVAWVRLPTGHNIYTLLFKSFNHITSYLLTYVFLNITHPQSLKIFKWSCLGNIPDYR